ncbi:MAG: hypothetical protein ACOC6J_11825 [Spirochaetota bacterium]
MKRGRTIILAVAVTALLGACASTKLAEYDYDGEPVAIVVRVAPGARVEADYFVTIDPDDPVTTILSIGSSVAKAGQVREAERKMEVALRGMEIDTIIEQELASYFGEVMAMRIAESRRRSSFFLNVVVEQYGIEASGPGSSVDFVVEGEAELFDEYTNDRIWRERFSRSEQFSPSVFGLPRSAGNVLSAAMLSELTEAQIAAGVERVTRDAAWEIAQEFESDLERARRRR